MVPINGFIEEKQSYIIKEIDKHTGITFLIKLDYSYKFNCISKPKLYYRNHNIHDSNNRFIGQMFRYEYDYPL